ncbi:hypothetical protein RI065_02770 [Mycoplasmatota bacterium zrk1]
MDISKLELDKFKNIRIVNFYFDLVDEINLSSNNRIIKSSKKGRND